MIELIRPAGDLGAFEIRRLLPSERVRSVGPFVLFDRAGPFTLRPGQGIDVRPHPHIGLSTLTYLFEGAIVHRDNLGVVQTIEPGAVNWMTAGRGIVHSERAADPLRENGGEIFGLQAWVALPEANEEDEPSFVHRGAHEHPVFRDRGAWGQLVAGQAHGETAPIPTFSPLFYVHWNLQPGASAVLPNGYEERCILVIRGHVQVAGQDLGPDDLAVIGGRENIAVTATTNATVIVFGGDILGERHLWWNFVSSRRDRIEQARHDWTAGRMTLPPGDDQEWIEAPPQG